MKQFLFVFTFSLTFFPLLIAQTQIGQSLDGAGRNDFFGQAVTISADGTTIAVTSRLIDDISDNDGEVQVFRRTGNTWTQIGQDIEDVRSFSFIENIALSADGSIIVVGAPRKSTNILWDGRVTVFQLIGDTWQQLGQNLNGVGNMSEFGTHVAASADGLTIAIGSPRDDAGGTDAGLVRVYRLVNNSWVSIGQDILGEGNGDFMGFQVDLSADGNRVAVGAHSNSDNANQSGNAKVFDLNGGQWIQVGQTLRGVGAGDRFGAGLALSSDGTTLAVGAPDNGSGGALVEYVTAYRMNGNSWTQIGQVLADPPLGLDSGNSLSLSNDGNILAIGSYAERDPVTNDFLGSVRAFTLVNDSWTAYGNPILGAIPSTSWGYVVSLSDDGQTVVAGAHFYPLDGNSATGQVRVFNLDPNLPVALTSFSAALAEKNVTLSWHTSSETGSRGFYIEHYSDQQHWQEIGFVSGAGESDNIRNYSFLHTSPESGINNYRLRQVDLDGGTFYSDIESVNYVSANNGLSIYPNPVINGTVQITIPLAFQSGSLNLHDAWGRRLLMQPAKLPTLNTANLSAGNYLIVVQNGSERLSEWIVVR